MVRGLFLRAEGVADLHAARGLAAVLGVAAGRVTVSLGRALAASEARRLLPGCRPGRVPPPGSRIVRFDADSPGRPIPGGAVFNHDPFKFHPGPSAGSRGALRRRMRLGRRRLIVCSLSGRAEVDAVVDAYKGLVSSPRPVLILGLRLPGRGIAARLARRGLRIYDRSSRGAGLGRVGACDAVVLNTMGELRRFLAAADLAVVGHDRNLFEPAWAGVPGLYFPEPVEMTPRQRKLAAFFDLVWRKNRTAKRLLDDEKGALPIDLAILSEQMTGLLADPSRVIAGARRAIRRYKREVVPAARRLAFRLLASRKWP